MNLKTAVLAAWACLACSPGMAQSATETFDHLLAQEIHPDNPLVLKHFRVELPLGGVAVIRRAEDDDELAGGMALGAPDNWTLASLMLHFEQPWRRVTFSLIMPPTTEERIRSLVMLYGADPASTASNSTLFWHGADRRRVRVELLRDNDDKPFQSVYLHLLRGAYVDNIQVDPLLPEADIPAAPAPMTVREPLH